MSGSPTTTTAPDSDNSTKIATTAFVQRTIDNESIKILQVLLVGGGGGGGCQSGGGVGPGGGGAGGVLTDTQILVSGASFNFTVGAGGSGKDSGNPSGDTGSNSTFGSLVAYGGGGGGGEAKTGDPGGSGGGGSGHSNSMGGTGVSGQGNNGGRGNNNLGGGGGGAGEKPDDATNVPDRVAGSGGNGIISSITGVATYYGGGGAGGRWFTSDIEGVAGLGGGGLSATDTEQAEDGVDGLGGGGGAGRGNWGGPSIRSGNGGNGVLIMRYPSSFTATYTGGSPSRSTVGNDTVDVVNFSGSVSF